MHKLHKANQREKNKSMYTVLLVNNYAVKEKGREGAVKKDERYAEKSSEKKTGQGHCP